MMLTKGVPSQTVILLLVLPVIAMILAFLKQIVGITTFGLYTPSIIALSFLALGWQIGVLFLCFIVATGYLTRMAMRRMRLLYIPKVAIILTVVSFTLLLLLGISAYFDVTFSRETIFILLIMSTLAESFLNLKTEQGWTSAILGIGETIMAALLCVFIVQWTLFQSIILAYPELLLLTIVVDVFWDDGRGCDWWSTSDSVKSFHTCRKNDRPLPLPSRGPRLECAQSSVHQAVQSAQSGGVRR
jgi:hypothetical protein